MQFEPSSDSLTESTDSQEIISEKIGDLVVEHLPLVKNEKPEEAAEFYDDGASELWQILKNRPLEERIAIKQAYLFARKAHRGQFRKSGEPYIIHLVAVAIILANLDMDFASLVAGLLHDTVEDVDWITFEMLQNKFGFEIARIVEGETKLSKISKRGGREAEVPAEGRDMQAENLRQMLIAMLEDPRVIFVKLADRLHNMRTLDSMPPHKQRNISGETMEVFAPLAHRLGIGQIKWELEDLSFRYLYPEEYEDLQRQLNIKREEREAVLEMVSQQLEEALKDDFELREEIDEIKVSGRIKNLWSIRNKMQKDNKTIEQIFDLLAVRIILTTSPVKSSQDLDEEQVEKLQERKGKRVCYHALNIVHSLWTPLPGRFKDYIAIPKSNGYRSLHTTMIAPTGQPLEVQIRSDKMHETAEYGFAAHWMYKANKKSSKKQGEIKFFSQAREMKDVIEDPSDYLDALKNDFLSGRVVVFTPKGKATALAKGSTVLDFAFHIHTKVGVSTIGARVNGKMVPISQPLHFGDMVEIITSKKAKPSAGWYEWVVTRSARTKIRHYLNQQEREDLLEKGKISLEKFLRKRGLASKKLMRTESLEQATQNLLGRSNPDELYLALASRQITPATVAKILEPTLSDKKTPKLPAKNKPVTSDSSVYVEGIDAPTKLSRCCLPARGDQIIGYMTRGRGVSIHRIDCPNLLRLLINDPERCVAASWTARPQDYYTVYLDIEAENRENLVRDALQVLVKHGVSLKQVQAKSDGVDANVYFEISISKEHNLELFCEDILNVRNIRRIRHLEKIPIVE